MESGGLTGIWPVDLLLALAALLGALVVIKRRAVDPVRKMYKGVRKLLRDLYGEDPEDLVEGDTPRPGVFARIEGIEKDVTAVKWEVETNGHSDSLRNVAVTAAQQALAARREVAALGEQLSDHITWSEALVAQQEGRLAGLSEAIEDLRERLPADDETDQ